MRLIFTMVIAAAMTVASPAVAQSKIAPGKLVELNGITMHYEERGQGEPLLLLHGFGMCGPGDWGDHVAELFHAAAKIRCDHWGYPKA